MATSESFKSFFTALPPAEQTEMKTAISSLAENANPAVNSAVPGKDLKVEFEQLYQALTQAKAREAAMTDEIAVIDARLLTLATFLTTSFSPEVLDLQTDLTNKKAILVNEKAKVVILITDLETRMTELAGEIQDLKEAGERSQQLLSVMEDVFSAGITVPAGPFARGSEITLTAQASALIKQAAIDLIAGPPDALVVAGTAMISGTQATLKVTVPAASTVPNVLLKVTVVAENGNAVPVFKEVAVA